MPVTLALVRQRLAHRPAQRVEEPGSIEAAVALILAPSGRGELEWLLIRRAEQAGDPWSGQMALPGGRRDPTDPDLLATAARETNEEVGIELRREWLIGELDDLHPRTRTLPPVVVRPFVFGLEHQPPIRRSSEVAFHVWVSLEELASGTTRIEILIPGRDRPFPAYRVGEHIVWGMTERIIASLIDLLK